MPDQSKKDARITIRLTTAEAGALKHAAARRDRTTNWLTRHIISAWLSKEHKSRTKSR